MMDNIENNHDFFNAADFEQAKSRAMELVSRFDDWLKPGINFQKAELKIDELSKELGFEKKWHPTKVRFGSDTMKTFREVSDPEILHTEGGIYFVDIGFVYKNHESDFGKTFGSEVHRPLIDACENVFNLCQEGWLNEKLSGEALYRFAESKARELGFELNPKMAGHRLGSFPHAVFHKGKLSEYEDVASPDKWVLEIHLVDFENGVGAFFESVL